MASAFSRIGSLFGFNSTPRAAVPGPSRPASSPLAPEPAPVELEPVQAPLKRKISAKRAKPATPQKTKNRRAVASTPASTRSKAVIQLADTESEEEEEEQEQEEEEEEEEIRFVSKRPQRKLPDSAAQKLAAKAKLQRARQNVQLSKQLAKQKVVDEMEYAESADEKITKALSRDTKSREITSTTVECLEGKEDQQLTLRIGDCVRISDGSDAAGAGYIAQVGSIRQLTGKTQKKADLVWIEARYMYFASDFQGLKKGHAWRAPARLTDNLGLHEVIPTDHVDWHTTATIVHEGSPEIVFDFDDQYPISLSPTSPSKKGKSTKPVAFAAPISDHPFAYRSLAEFDSLPFFFFANGSDGNYEGAHYMRVAFEFDSQPTGPLSALAATLSDRESPAKKQRMQQGDKRRLNAKVLNFNLHSTSRTPYNPQNVQHFSPSSSKWYNVKDLCKSHSFSPLPDKVKVVVAREDWEEEEEGSAGECFDSDAEEGAYSETSLYHEETKSSARIRRSESEWDSIRQAESRKQHRTRRAIAHFHTPTVDNLARLANSKIVRGGPFGLIGNSVLVITAQRLVPMFTAQQPLFSLVFASSAPRRTESGFDDILELTSTASAHVVPNRQVVANAVSEVLDAHAAWMRIVARSTNPDLSEASRAEILEFHLDSRRGEGNGLAGLEGGDKFGLPSGMGWVCPVSGEFI